MILCSPLFQLFWTLRPKKTLSKSFLGVFKLFLGTVGQKRPDWKISALLLTPYMDISRCTPIKCKVCGLWSVLNSICSVQFYTCLTRICQHHTKVQSAHCCVHICLFMLPNFRYDSWWEYCWKQRWPVLEKNWNISILCHSFNSFNIHVCILFAFHCFSIPCLCICTIL